MISAACALAGGCGVSPTALPVSSAAAGMTIDCGPYGRAGPVISYQSSDGSRFKAVRVGIAARVVVLAHQSDQTLCNELAFARTLASNGFAVFVPNLRSDSAAGITAYNHWDVGVAAAIAEARALGAKRVQVLGASQGGCAALVGATEVAPPAAAVVSLSGERQVADLNCDDAAARFAGALLVVASADDHYLTGSDAAALLRESPSHDKRALVVPGTVHGYALLQQGDVLAQVIAFLQQHG